ncbi:hypothetical protein [Desulfogranum japonicum]|uniref:hypothetical protein n=1 Tax=Desulfogranum japonicum TaxID=231447 RepID=UPI00041B5CA6|nr:hypothetical protein [Desulfogranum japonicum]
MALLINMTTENKASRLRQPLFVAERYKRRVKMRTDSVEMHQAEMFFVEKMVSVIANFS